MTLPFWAWYVTMVVGVGSISIAGFVVIFMKIAELDERYRPKREDR